jgi:hypothetical protein
MKIHFTITGTLILTLVVSCAPGDQYNHPAVHEKQASIPEQRTKALPSGTITLEATSDTIVGFLRNELTRRNLLSSDECLSLDHIDVENGCYTLLQETSVLSGKQMAKRWLYYPKTKTLVDVAGEAELSLADEGYTKEDRDKMKNLQIERLAP